MVGEGEEDDTDDPGAGGGGIVVNIPMAPVEEVQRVGESSVPAAQAATPDFRPPDVSSPLAPPAGASPPRGGAFDGSDVATEIVKPAHTAAASNKKRLLVIGGVALGLILLGILIIWAAG